MAEKQAVKLADNADKTKLLDSPAAPSPQLNLLALHQAERTQYEPAPPKEIHQLGVSGLMAGTALTGAYSEFVHPSLQKGLPTALAKSVEIDSEYQGSVGLAKKVAIPLILVGTEAQLKASAAQALHERGADNIARILEPNLPGTIAKSAALLTGPMLPSTTRQLAYLAGAELLETETNMTRAERLATGTGLLATGAVMKVAGIASRIPGLSKFGTTAMLASVAIGAAAEAADDLLYYKPKAAPENRPNW